jgi:ATP-binding cassette subfamily B protein
VLSGVYATFHKGKKYLITGKSGSGKSTLLNLIAGLYDNYTGSIKIDNCEVRDLNKNDLANLVVYTAQEPFLYDGTLYENICLFAKTSKAEATHVLEQVGLAAFLQKQPLGLDTNIGENGVIMSGGEKQRLAIARALIRNSSILLLDESTSHLDKNTAAEIEHLVMTLDGITVLLVSHSPTETALRLADEVVSIS